MRDLDDVRMFIAATKENSEFRNTARHKDPGKFITALLWANQEEMECEEEEGRMVAGKVRGSAACSLRAIFRTSGSGSTTPT